jgi:hypothetical protein
MRILLDENTPRGVRRILTGHDVRTAPEMGWAAIANGQLLDEAEKAGFDAVITSDQNFVFQQNLLGRNIAVVVLSTNTWPLIRAQPQIVRRRRQRHTRKLHRRDVRPPAQTPPPGTRPQMLKQPFSDQPPRAHDSPTVARFSNSASRRLSASAVSSA